LLFRDELNKQKDHRFTEKLSSSLIFIGDEKNACIEAGKDKVYIQSIDTAQYSSVTLTDAIPYITEQAKQTRLVCINEDPYQTQHRLYATILLQKLHESGYNYLALDCIDSSLPIHRITSASGYALYEPLYADFIREALNLDFKIISVPAQQAATIITILKQDTTAKMIFYTANSIEENDTARKPMSVVALIKQQSGIDPLTIDQSTIAENGNNNFLTSLTYYWQTKHVFTRPMLLMEQSHPWQLSADHQHDVYIIHPKAGFVNTRPAWLQYYNYRRHIFISPPLTVMKTSFLMQAYLADETKTTPVDQLIPFDQTYYLGTRQAILFLKPHTNYKIIYRDINNKIIGTQPIEL